jgi:hypothetical protein
MILQGGREEEEEERFYSPERESRRVSGGERGVE